MFAIYKAAYAKDKKKQKQPLHFPNTIRTFGANRTCSLITKPTPQKNNAKIKTMKEGDMNGVQTCTMSMQQKISSKLQMNKCLCEGIKWYLKIKQTKTSQSKKKINS
jgi:hypothetical protein